jgi:hypothetical protein
VQHVLDSEDHVGMGTVMQYDDTPCEHAGPLSFDGNMNVSEGSIHSTHSPMNISWMTTFGTKDLNDRSLILSG